MTSTTAEKPIISIISELLISEAIDKIQCFTGFENDLTQAIVSYLSEYSEKNTYLPVHYFIEGVQKCLSPTSESEASLQTLTPFLETLSLKFT